MQRRFVLWWCALGLAAPTLAHHARVQRADRSLKGWPIEPFTLTDHHGKPFSQANLRGQWTFVLFGDTRCAEPCTAALSALAGLCKRIERADALKTTQIVFVSVDPEHDTPQRLRDYLAPYGPRSSAAPHPGPRCSASPTTSGSRRTNPARAGPMPNTTTVDRWCWWGATQ